MAQGPTRDAPRLVGVGLAAPAAVCGRRSQGRARTATACQACGRAPKRICVLGAGVIGLSTALRISQAFADRHVEVCIVADKMGEETTSDGAGGLWEPYKLGNTSPELINEWGSETFSYLKGLYHSAEAAQAGVTEVAAYQLWRQPTSDPPWRDVVPHFHRLSESELQPFRSAELGSIAEGWCFTTMINEQRMYLQWLTTLVLKAGIRMHRRTIHSLQEFAEWDAAVNCSGLGALRLFQDKEMFTMRGHVIRVKAPWIKANYFIDEQNYIIPNVNNVVLGGTAQLNDLDLWPRDEDRQAILEGCMNLMPSLASAKVLGEWVGLRPCRSSVRLEAEQMYLDNEEHGERAVLVIHNYGHGGAGVTLHWGCAATAVRLLKDYL